MWDVVAIWQRGMGISIAWWMVLTRVCCAHWNLVEEECCGGGGLFFLVWPSSTSFVLGTLNTKGYDTILDNSVLLTVWQQFGTGPFLFQHDSEPVHKAKAMTEWLEEMRVVNFTVTPQSLDLNPTICGMNWCADCDPDLIDQKQPKSCSLHYRRNGEKYL